jgi:hypothetical protein
VVSKVGIFRSYLGIRYTADFLFDSLNYNLILTAHGSRRSNITLGTQACRYG